MNKTRSLKSRGIFILILILLAALFNSSLAASSHVALVAPKAAEIFAAKCAKCHGTDGRGLEKYKKHGQKDFTDSDWQKTRSDAELTESIEKGKGDFMPAWKGKLSSEEIKALVTYVRAFGKKK